MSFFNLTLTGVQDPFKTASYNKEEQTNRTNSYIIYCIKSNTANFCVEYLVLQ